MSNRALILLSAVAISMALVTSSHAQSAPQPLDTPADCAAISGRWSPVGALGIVAFCELAQSHEVPAGTTLRVGENIILQVMSGGRLVNRGELLIPADARVTLAGGQFRNHGHMHVDAGGRLNFDGGDVINFGSIDIAGDFHTTNTERDANGARLCLLHRGTMALYHGGNLFNNGCIDGVGGGRIDIYPGSGFFNLSQGMYHGPFGDRIYGQFIQSPGALAELRDALVGNGGLLRSRGRLIVGFGSFTIARGGLVELDPGATMRIDGNHLRVFGVLHLDDARISGNRLDVSIGSTGSVRLENGSTAWANNYAVDVANEGSIRLDCYSAWHITGDFTGNPLLPEPCRWPPIEPTLPWPGL